MYFILIFYEYPQYHPYLGNVDIRGLREILENRLILLMTREFVIFRTGHNCRLMFYVCIDGKITKTHLGGTLTDEGF